jgi:hypothetical protein
MSYPIEKLAFDCRSKVVQIISHHDSVQFVPSVGILINKGYIVTHSCSCYIDDVRAEQIYAVIDINNERRISLVKLIGIDPHYNLAVLHIGKQEMPFFQWKKGKSRNMKPGEIVFAIGCVDDICAFDIQAGIICTNNHTATKHPGECIVTSGITGCCLGSPLVNNNGHVVGICVGQGIWLSEYSMRAVIRSLCKFEFSPIHSTSGKYILYPRKFIGCIADVYKGEYFFTNPNQHTSLIAGYKIIESFIDNIFAGDVMTHIVINQKQYTLGAGRGQISASTLVEKTINSIVIKGFRILELDTIVWETEVVPTERHPVLGLI